MHRPTPRALADQLTQLHAGDRAWFWLCPDAPPPTPPLLLRALRDDPDATILHAETTGLEGGSTPIVGLASVDGLGLLTLCGPGLSHPALAALAQWCRSHCAAHPGLLRLRDTTMVRTDRVHQVRGRFADPALWAGLPSLNPGLSEHTGRELAALSASVPHWFWLSEARAGEPVLLLGDIDSDPDGALFAEEVRAMLRPGHRGTIQRTPAGLLAFSSPDPIRPLAAAVRALGLPDAVLFQTRDDCIIDTLHVQGTP